MSEPKIISVAMQRTKRLFKFLSELNKLGNPPCTRIEEQPWTLWFRDLPTHPAIRRGIKRENGAATDRTNPTETASEDDFVLQVKRPTITTPPPPPESLLDWVTNTWQKIEGQPEHLPDRNISDEKGETVTIRFDDDPERVTAFGDWEQKWQEWSDAERPARDALKVFERLYALHGQIEREAERVELYAGDGILEWPRTAGNISHPILLQRLQLDFAPQVPEFTLRDTAHPVDLYSGLLRTIEELPGSTLSNCRQEVQQGGLHPLDGESTSGFLERMIQAMHPLGKLVDGKSSGPKSDPVVRRDPVIFLQNRTQGFATTFEAILEQLNENEEEEIPKSILRVIGVETDDTPAETTSSSPTSHYANEDEQILFSKAANPEQLQIAERLERAGSVLVQGPPGTGKTHTIANLVGHLLASNQTVLVTSHSTKALRVLRDQIVDNLRPLCVSVLESDSQSQEQLKAAVESIVQRLSESSTEQLDQQAERSRQRRDGLIQAIRRTREQLTAARLDEYRDVVVAGKGYPPSQAARFVAAGATSYSWIPGSVEPAVPCPLTDAELLELYQSNASLPPGDEAELCLALPDLNNLPAPSLIEKAVAQRQSYRSEDLRHGVDLWHFAAAQEIVVPCKSCGARNRVTATNFVGTVKCGKCGQPILVPVLAKREELEAQASRLSDLRERCTKAAEVVVDAESQRWRLAAVTAGVRGDGESDVWSKLVEMIDAVRQKAAEAQEPLLTYDPKLHDGIDLDEQLSLLNEIAAHVNGGGRLSGISVLFRKRWKQLLSGITVNDKPPSSKAHIQALKVAAELRKLRSDLARRWSRQMTPLAGPSVESLGEQIEISCSQFCQGIRDCLAWWSETWKPLRAEFAEVGLLWDKLLERVPARLDEFGDVLRLKDAVTAHLPKAIQSCVGRLNVSVLALDQSAVIDTLDRTGSPEKVAPVVMTLRESVEKFDATSYRTAYQRLAELLRLKELSRRRSELAAKLGKVAPNWATAIRTRQGVHGRSDLPGDPQKAWLYSQFSQELRRRSETSLPHLQEQIEVGQRELQSVTAELVDRQAWSAQIARTKLAQRQALIGWLQTIKKIGRGTGKRVPQLRLEARKLMEQSRTAVPVWIMPLSRVAENFEPRAGLFDVVIIDEASQSSVLELLAFYLGKRVVVVGDHEQVSPDAVGQNQAEVQHLIEEYLDGIPNAKLYDGQLSVYDLAMSSFGGTICLREHFRCVPEIIQFSNYLSYQGQIKPLRDSSQVQLRPYTICHRVNGAMTGTKLNEVEAREVASLLIAATEQPEYAGKTFGVISLVGDSQAYRIDEILRARLSPETYEARRIMCGNSAQFQGDERDVMFLSMVDVSDGGPLALRTQPMFQKRFNVAASRSKDQMWVVHSLNPETDLKPNDLRLRLIRHAIDPNEVTRELASASAKAESEFERLVIEQLVRKGYRVVPQWKAGYYRIDMVVVGTNARLAVECDGDRYHPPEKLHEDMQRQAVLERNKWKFVRIRGSEFFQNPELAMRPTFERLERLGIEPLGPDQKHSDSDVGDCSLAERVRVRAAELQRDWAEALEEPEVSFAENVALS